MPRKARRASCDRGPCRWLVGIEGGQDEGPRSSPTLIPERELRGGAGDALLGAQDHGSEQLAKTMVEVGGLGDILGKTASGNLGAGVAEALADDPVIRGSWPEEAPGDWRAVQVDLSEGKGPAPKLKPHRVSWKAAPTAVAA